MIFEDAQAELDTYLADQISEDLSCADSCDTEEDFIANIKSAIGNAQALIVHLKELLAD